MLEELHQEITKAECYGSTEIIIFMNPVFMKMFNIDATIRGYKVEETTLVTDFKVIFDYE